MKLILQTKDGVLGSRLAAACEGLGHEVRSVAPGETLEPLIAAENFDLAVVDLADAATLSGGVGAPSAPSLHPVRGLEALCVRHPGLRVLALSSDTRASAVVDALQQGASEVLVKPFGVDELEPALRRAAGSLRSAFDWVGVAGASRALLERARRAAVTDATLLVRGELGVGKTHLARLIHALGPRHAGPCIEIDLSQLEPDEAAAALFGHVRRDGCRSLGRIEAARGGTLIVEGIEALRSAEPAESTARHARGVDEARDSSGERGVCDASEARGASPAHDARRIARDRGRAIEAMLLSFLDRREIQPIGAAASFAVDTRIVATLRSSGRERDSSASALEQRLAVNVLDVLPLAERRDDIPALALHFAEGFASARHSPVPRFDDESMAALCVREFAANVTELRSIIERAAIMFPGAEVGRVELAGLCGEPLETPVASSTGLEALNLREMERAAVLRSLELARGNRTVAARALGVSTRTLRNKLRSYGLHGP